MRGLGQSIPHESAGAHVTGKALYTDDLSIRMPRLLHAWPVQAPHAHALVQGIEAQKALCEPGVVTVLIREDVPGENDTGVARHDEPLFPTEVMYHGQAIAWVLAESLEAARKGAAQIQVDYSLLPAILTIEEAIAQQSFHVGPLRLCRGIPVQMFLQSPLRLEGSLQIGGQEHFYLETNTAIAYQDEAGLMMIHSSTQHPAETQAIVARVLGLAKNQVVVQCVRIGGGFGGKEVQANPWAAVAALGAWKTGRPVSVRLPRHLDMVLTGKRHPFLGRFKVGFTQEGKLLALQLALYSDGGWSLDLSEAVLWRALFHCDNAYFIPHVEVKGWVCKTHKTSQTAFRGFGGPQGMMMVEEVIDRVARSLGMPPEVVRETNLYREGDTTHYGQEVKDAVRIRQIWEQLKSESRFRERRQEIARFNAHAPHCKRGIAITPVKFGIAFTTTFFNQAGALVLIYRDGSIQVNHGGIEMGTGLHTKIRQIAAEALGVPLEWIQVMPTRTDKIPNTSATAASTGVDLNGEAVKAACDTLKQRLAQVASQHFAIDPAEVVFAAGKVYPVGAPERARAFSQMVHEAYLQRVSLFAEGFYRTPDLHFDPEQGQGKPFHYFAYGAAVSEVEVDGFTGQYHLRRVDILHDVGDSLSPLIDRGQIEGGFFQGLGWLTLEELVWDATSGKLLTQGASTYKLPSWSELPPIFQVRFLERATDPDVIYGSKAVGEPPLMLAIAVREALKEAIAAFGEGDIVELGAPSTPEAVYWAIAKIRAQLPKPTTAGIGISGLEKVEP